MSLITLPYTFTNGPTNLIDAPSMMTQFGSIVSVVNGLIDNTNVNTSVGILANQITVAAGNSSVGGSLPWTFPNGLFSGTGYVPPVYTTAGVCQAAQSKIVLGNVTAAGASTTVTLTGSAQFTGLYIAFIQDSSTSAMIYPTTRSNASFVFASTSGHVYYFLLVGN
jgi:hypothetical protein